MALVVVQLSPRRYKSAHHNVLNVMSAVVTPRMLMPMPMTAAGDGDRLAN